MIYVILKIIVLFWFSKIISFLLQLYALDVLMHLGHQFVVILTMHQQLSNRVTDVRVISMREIGREGDAIKIKYN